MRALIVTNMYPTPRRPALGSFVRDQVRALERAPDLELELFHFEPGAAGGYGAAARELRRRFRGTRFDVIHAHFGLTLWPSLAARGQVRALTMHGTDLYHPRSRAITLAGLRLIDLPATSSESLRSQVPQWASRRPVELLPCGVDLERFHPVPRTEARAALGLDPDQRYLLFPADPARPEKRYDRAAQVAGDTPLLTLGAVAPEQVPLWVNAADAVLVPSERESFGLAVLEALACEVPVLATPVGVAPQALAGLEGAYCGPFEPSRWRAELGAHLQEGDPRIEGRERAADYSATRMAERVLEAWRRGLRRT